MTSSNPYFLKNMKAFIIFFLRGVKRNDTISGSSKINVLVLSLSQSVHQLLHFYVVTYKTLAGSSEIQVCRSCKWLKQGQLCLVKLFRVKIQKNVGKRRGSLPGPKFIYFFHFVFYLFIFSGGGRNFILNWVRKGRNIF